ncbi:hypothetical protein Q7P37_010890 [Cladosporium fusiforme]
MHFRNIYAPLAISAAIGFFSQGALACGTNCGDGSCTVVEDSEQYNFHTNAASRGSGSPGDCEKIYDSWPTGDGEFSDETWTEGECKIRLIKGNVKNCISWDQLRTATRMMLDQACDDDSCKGGIEPKSARDDSFKAMAGSSLCVMGDDSTCWVPACCN